MGHYTYTPSPNTHTHTHTIFSPMNPSKTPFKLSISPPRSLLFPSGVKVDLVHNVIQYARRLCHPSRPDVIEELVFIGQMGRRFGITSILHVKLMFDGLENIASYFISHSVVFCLLFWLRYNLVYHSDSWTFGIPTRSVMWSPPTQRPSDRAGWVRSNPTARCPDGVRIPDL